MKTYAENKKIEALEELDFKYREEYRLTKVHDKLYIPQDFEKDHNYYANPEGTKRYYGITKVLEVIAKPALIGWASNTNTATIKEKAVYHEPTDTYVVSSALLEEARVAHTKKKDTAGEQGTTVHAEIESYINYCMNLNNGTALPIHASIKEEIEKQTAEFVNWAVSNKVRFIGAEVRLYSEKLWVAGTADFLCEKDGKLMIGDVKTSNSGIYSEHFLQGTAYAHMAREMGLHEDFKGVVIVNIPKRGGIVVKENYDLKGNFQAFKAALTLFKFKESQKVKKLKK